jgi:hypothetical protein
MSVANRLMSATNRSVHCTAYTKGVTNRLMPHTAPAMCVSHSATTPAAHLMGASHARSVFGHREFAPVSRKYCRRLVTSSLSRSNLISVKQWGSRHLSALHKEPVWTGTELEDHHDVVRRDLCQVAQVFHAAGGQLRGYTRTGALAGPLLRC